MKPSHCVAAGALTSLLLLPGCSGGGVSPSVSASTRDAARIEIPKNGWSEEKKARHALNRLAYGPRPGDVDAVAKQGVGAWVRSQLDPASLPDDALRAKLRAFPTLSMSIAELNAAYPRPQALAKAAGVAADDPDAKAKTRDLANMRDLVDPRKLPRNIGRELAAQKVIRAVESPRQLEEVLVDFWFNHFNVFLDKGEDRWMLTAYERDAIRPNVFGSFRELLGATAKHPAMLFYLDNWISTKEGFDPTAAMTRRGKGGRRNGGRMAAAMPETQQAAKAKRRAAGLNENYARELLELHTLGVDGGYTQADVREVARCFTGWSIEKPREKGAFVFRGALHDTNAKTVLGVTMKSGGGQGDGEKVLDLLAQSPVTARFVATKLCKRFIADDPPKAAVDRVAAAFLRTGGDLRAVYAVLFSSPELWSDQAFAAKTKTPREPAAAAVRALGGTTTGGPALAQQIAKMGEPLYQCQPPTGYTEVADAWVNAGALLNRLNFGLAVAAGRVPGVKADVSALAPAADDADALVDTLSRAILPVPLSTSTRETILRTLSPTDTDGVTDGERRRPDSLKVAGLLLGSPEFQKQ